jgi:hypothetical protein
MAARNFTQFSYGLEKKPVRLFGKITFGSTGAPTLSTADSKGIASVSRTSAGLFVITLSDKYQRVMSFSPMFVLAAGSFPAAALAQITADTVSTDKKVTVQFSDADTPAATDPASGEVLLFELVLSDSTAK